MGMKDYLSKTKYKISKLRQSIEEIKSLPGKLSLEIGQAHLESTFGEKYLADKEDLKKRSKEYDYWKNEAASATSWGERRYANSRVEGLCSNSEEKRNAYIENIKNFRLSKKLAMAYALSMEKIVRFSCYSPVFGYYMDTENTSCPRCHETLENIKTLGLESFYKKGAGDRNHYGADEIDKYVDSYNTDTREIEETILKSTSEIKNEEKRDKYTSKVQEYKHRESKIPNKERALKILQRKKEMLERFIEEKESAVRNAKTNAREKMRSELIERVQNI